MRGARSGAAVADRARRRRSSSSATCTSSGAWCRSTSVPANGDDRRRSSTASRLRQRDQGAGRGQHLPRRHAVQELRRDAPRPRRVLRLRRDRVPDRLQLPHDPGSRATRKTTCRASPGIRSARTTFFPRRSARSCSAIPRAAKRSCSITRRLLRSLRLATVRRIDLLRGELPDFFPYDSSARFCMRYPERFADARSAPAEPQSLPGRGAQRARGVNHLRRSHDRLHHPPLCNDFDLSRSSNRQRAS